VRALPGRPVLVPALRLRPDLLCDPLQIAGRQHETVAFGQVRRHFARRQLLPGEPQDFLHCPLALVKALALNGFPIEVLQRNGHFVCRRLHVYDSFHLRPSG
jgi:hypothetical protein